MTQETYFITDICFNMFTCSVFLHIFLILHTSPCIYMQSDETTEMIKNACKERNQLIGSDKNELYQFVDILLNETLSIDCHYCRENDINEAKVWYKIEQYNQTAHEVKLDMHKDEAFNRISVSTDHTLTIHNVTLEDAGIFYCQGQQGQESENMFNYIVDITFNDTLVEKVNISQWKQYHDDYMLPINSLFLNNNASDYALMRNIYKTKLEVVTEWESDWQPCVICGRPKGEGIQEKQGYCRIKIHNAENQDLNLSTFNNSAKVAYFLKSSEISCVSQLLAELFPAISNRTRGLLNFVLVRKCDGVCSLDAGGASAGWKTGKTKGFKYRKMLTLDMGSHLTLTCPESTLENTIVWRKNGKKLDQGESSANDASEPHVFVDTFNTLYLIHVTSEEAGNYTCQVDDIRMQQVRVFIQPKSRLLTQEFARHMGYLSFILFLTLFCYCGGLVITCKRRHTFKQYEQVATEIY